MSLSSSSEAVTKDVLDKSEEELGIYLAHHFVSKTFGLIRMENDRPFPLQALFLTFEAPVLPTSTFIGYDTVPVYPYIRNPIQCLHFQRFGHTKEVCLKLSLWRLYWAWTCVPVHHPT